MESLKVSCSSKGLTYKEAGVDIDAGSELVKRIAKMAPGIGGFGGLFPLGIIDLFMILLICYLLFLEVYNAFHAVPIWEFFGKFVILMGIGGICLII